MSKNQGKKRKVPNLDNESIKVKTSANKAFLSEVRGMLSALNDDLERLLSERICLNEEEALQHFALNYLYLA